MRLYSFVALIALSSSLIGVTPSFSQTANGIVRLRQIEKQCGLKKGTLTAHAGDVWVDGAQEAPVQRTNCALRRLGEVDTIDDVAFKPKPDNPTDAERQLLLGAAAKCNMHAGAVYFIQRQAPIEPVIHITRALGDTDDQALCVQSLPNDFSRKFGLDVEPPRPR